MTSPLLRFNDGRNMAQLGFGRMRFGNEEQTGEVMARALACGFRLFDMAASYGMEALAGKAARSAAVVPAPQPVPWTPRRSGNGEQRMDGRRRRSFFVGTFSAAFQSSKPTSEQYLRQSAAIFDRSLESGDVAILNPRNRSDGCARPDPEAFHAGARSQH